MSIDHMIGVLESIDGSITVRHSWGYGIHAEVEPDSREVVAWRELGIYARQEDGHVAVTMGDLSFPQNWEVSGLPVEGVGVAMGFLLERAEMFRSLLEDAANRQDADEGGGS